MDVRIRQREVTEFITVEWSSPMEFHRLYPSTVINSVTTLCLIPTSTTSAVLHCDCVERTRLTGAPMIIVDVDSVTVRWVWQEILTRRHIKKK